MGARTKRSLRESTLELLKNYESPNVTFIEGDGSWPIVWKKANGANVWDEDGKKYLDLTAAFGVAATGHGNPRVIQAGQRQMKVLMHAMGDVHPHRLKAELARELSRITYEKWESGSGKAIFCNSGFEAVEVALKTATLATGKSRVIAFEGAYHGLGYGALNVTHREYFRTPFQIQLGQFGQFVRFPKDPADLGPIQSTLTSLLEANEFSSILVEPIQVRGGVNIPPPEFLPLLRQLCDHYNVLLIVDEIYTGFGRTGRWFACEHGNVVPDIMCLGKALTGGFPLSVCVGKSGIIDAWPPSQGEAIHTSTFLGHPVGCAMALAQIKELNKKKLCSASERKGELLLRQLQEIGTAPRELKLSARGLGLLAGLELRTAEGKPATEQILKLIKRLLHRGFIFLPEGEHSNVLSFTPPLTITKGQLQSSISALQQELGGI